MGKGAGCEWPCSPPVHCPLRCWASQSCIRASPCRCAPQHRAERGAAWLLYPMALPTLHSCAPGATGLLSSPTTSSSGVTPRILAVKPSTGGGQSPAGSCGGISLTPRALVWRAGALPATALQWHCCRSPCRQNPNWKKNPRCLGFGTINHCGCAAQIWLCVSAKKT